MHWRTLIVVGLTPCMESKTEINKVKFIDFEFQRIACTSMPSKKNDLFLFKNVMHNESRGRLAPPVGVRVLKFETPLNGMMGRNN